MTSLLEYEGAFDDEANGQLSMQDVTRLNPKLQ